MIAYRFIMIDYHNRPIYYHNIEIISYFDRWINVGPAFFKDELWKNM